MAHRQLSGRGSVPGRGAAAAVRYRPVALPDLQKQPHHRRVALFRGGGQRRGALQVNAVHVDADGGWPRVALLGVVMNS